MNLLALVGLFVLLAADSSAQSPSGSDAAAWREACRVSGYSCVWISPPFVAKAPLVDILGRYAMGDRYILVREDLTGPLAYAVRVHEMTHFLQWKHGKWKFTKLNSCDMEHEAFDVSNTVLRRLGDTKDLVDWNVMKFQYGCP